MNDQTIFHEVDFDPRLVDPQELDDKVAAVLQAKLEPKVSRQEEFENQPKEVQTITSEDVGEVPAELLT